MREKNKEILRLTGNKPWITHPHVLAMKIDPSWKPFDFLIKTSNILVQSISTGDARIIICFHPRIGKTTLAVLYLIVWFLNLWPNKTVILATYSESFAEERARLVRNTILDNQNFLAVRLAPDSQSSSRFHTDKQGGLISLGIGSGISGLPCDLLVIDDIYSSFSKAQIPHERNKVVEWFQDCYMRLQPKGSVVVSGARTHPLDLQGYLIGEHSDKWKLVSFSALSEGKEIDALKRAKGTALCPTLYDVDTLRRIEKSVGPRKWAAQYMQEPLQDKAEDGVQIVFPEDIISQIKTSHLPAFEDMPLPYEPLTTNYLSVDFGKKHSHTALILCHVVDSEDKDPDKSELHITFLKQYPLKTLLRSVVKDLDKFSLNPKFGDLCPVILVDASGSGAEYALEEMKKRGIKPIIPIVVLSTGKSKSHFRVPKELLIENLIHFISDGRLKVSPNLQNSDLLFSELRSYRARVSPKRRSITYKPYSQETDDLIDGLAMCTWAALKRWQPMYSQQSEKLYEHSLTTRRPISKNRYNLYSGISKSQYALFNPEFANFRGWR